MEKDAKYWEAQWQQRRADDARKDVMQNMAAARRYMDDVEQWMQEADAASDSPDSAKYDEAAVDRAESQVQNVMRRMMDAQAALMRMQSAAAYRKAAQ